MTGGKFLVLRFIPEQGLTALVVVAGAVVFDPFRKLRKGKFPTGLAHGGTRRHIVQGIFRADAAYAQNAVKGRAKLRKKGQRAAEIDHFSLDFPTLGKAGHRLVDHGVQNAQGDVIFLGPLIQQGLNVGFREHAAAGSDAVGALAGFRDLIELVRGNVQKGGHLVDEGPGAAGAGAVHAHLHRAGKEQDLRVLASQLDHHVRLRQIGLYGGAGGVNLLHEGNVQILRQPHTGGAGNAQPGGRGLRKLLPDSGKHTRSLFRDLGKMALVFPEYRRAGFIEHNAF